MPERIEKSSAVSLTLLSVLSSLINNDPSSMSICHIKRAIVWASAMRFFKTPALFLERHIDSNCKVEVTILGNGIIESRILFILAKAVKDILRGYES